jgi:hypothetical protein
MASFVTENPLNEAVPYKVRNNPFYLRTVNEPRVNTLVEADNEGRPYRIFVKGQNESNAKSLTDITDDYAGILGSASLQEIIRTLSDQTKERTEPYDEAIRKLILIRLILAGAIQFRKDQDDYKLPILNSWSHTVGRPFKKITFKTKYDPMDIQQRLNKIFLDNSRAVKIEDMSEFQDVISGLIPVVLTVVGISDLGAFFSELGPVELDQLKSSNNYRRERSIKIVKSILLSIGGITSIITLLLIIIEGVLLKKKLDKSNEMIIRVMGILLDKFIVSNPKIMHIIALPDQSNNSEFFTIPALLNKNEETRGIYYSYINRIRRLVPASELNSSFNNQIRNETISFNNFVSPRQAGGKRRTLRKNRKTKLKRSLNKVRR